MPWAMPSFRIGGIGHEDIVADELHAVAECFGQRAHPGQSPSPRPSSIEAIGYWRVHSS